ncbi:MAG: alpha-ribazole phosphatase family protein [Propionivibrio sp.]
MPVYLIRHPRPLIADGVCYGQLDIDCEDPAPVAARLRQLLPRAVPLVSSPLRRARRLAEMLAPTLQIDRRLAEISFGEWEGRTWNDIGRAAIDAWANDVLHFAPPSGESVVMLQARVVDFARSLPDTNVAVVAHAGVLRALAGYWRKLPLAEWSQLDFEFGSLTIIERLPTDASP